MEQFNLANKPQMISGAFFEHQKPRKNINPWLFLCFFVPVTFSLQAIASCSAVCHCLQKLLSTLTLTLGEMAKKKCDNRRRRGGYFFLVVPMKYLFRNIWPEPTQARKGGGIVE